MKLFFIARNFLHREIARFSAALCITATLAMLAGCGAGNTSGPAAPPGAAAAGTPATTLVPAAAIQLLVSSPQIFSSGASTVDLTAIVLSATRQVVSGTTVTFSTGTDTTAFVNNISASGVSDTNGIVTAKLNLGANKANRTITITATDGAVTATNSVDVAGTTITVSGGSSLAFGASTTLTLALTDSAGVAVPGITLSVASANGNTVVRTPATGITNSSGQITAVVTANAVPAANDTITATGGGATKTQALTVSSASFTFTAPAAATEIPLVPTIPPVPPFVSTPISVNWTSAGVPVAGSLVSFSSTRGTITGSPATTNATGDTPGVTISSASAGPAIITASGPGGAPAASLNVVFVATTASSLTVQAVPGTVQVTTGAAGQTSNSSTISVVVRDAANNLVKNASVNFTIATDPTGGSLTAASGTTDVNGTASVTYIGGAISSGQNGVIISATVTAVNGVPIVLPPSTATLTVSGQPLLVRLGTDNLVGSAPPVNNKTWAAVVTDASGNAVVGATVRFALRPGQYRKGFYTPGAETWVRTVNVTCANEDLNFNGIIDPLASPPPLPASQTEDTNLNGSLEPGGIATVNATGVTDDRGIATAIVTYPKDHATWAEVILEARTGVVGNDPPTTVTFFLVGLADDYNDLLVPPPGIVSPYGAGVAPNDVCSNTL